MFCSMLHFLRKFNLIEIKFHPAVIGVQTGNFFNAVLFVVKEYFHIKIAQQVEIDLESVVAYGYYKITIGIQCVDFLGEREVAEFFPGDHQRT